MNFKDQKRKSPAINITSLIDVMFILIIFFMVSSSFIDQPGMKLELPKTASSEVNRVERCIVFISKEGEIYVNSQQIPPDSLTSAIKKIVPNLVEKTLVLKADQAAQHGLVVHIMDIAKRNGLEKIVIGTESTLSE